MAIVPLDVLYNYNIRSQIDIAEREKVDYSWGENWTATSTPPPWREPKEGRDPRRHRNRVSDSVRDPG